jgi:hypothetical protein
MGKLVSPEHVRPLNVPAAAVFGDDARMVRPLNHYAPAAAEIVVDVHPSSRVMEVARLAVGSHPNLLAIRQA